MTLGSLYNKVSSLNVDEVCTRSIEVVAGDFSEENKKQLYAGFDKEGSRLRSYRSNKYARVKNQMNPGPGLGNPDLKVTGSFYRGIKTRVEGSVIVVHSDDSKNDDLEKKYGGIFGLGGRFKSEFIDQSLKPAFMNLIHESTGL